MKTQTIARETNTVREIGHTMKSRIMSRLGYVESAHKDEVLKGALLATRIIEEHLLHIGAIKPYITSEPLAE